MKDQKELKSIYMDIIKNEVWSDSKMVDYERKNCAYVVELSNGDIISLDKPKIKKDFCFGYGFNGVSSVEEEDRANKAARQTEEKAGYFIRENMKQITDKIDSLKKCIGGPDECYTFVHYSGQPDNSKLKSYSCCALCYNPDYEPGYWSNNKGLKKLNDDDIQAIINGLEEVKKSFMKRIQAYLKKYGLSKLNVWTYLVD